MIHWSACLLFLACHQDSVEQSPLKVERLEDVTCALQLQAKRLQSIYLKCTFDTWMADIDCYPAPCLKENTCPTTPRYSFEGLWVQHDLHRYWETFSPKAPDMHWLGWNDGERWNTYQPHCNTGDVGSRPPEQSGIMPCNYFLEVEGLALPDVLSKWDCELTPNQRDDDLRGYVHVTAKDPSTTRSRTVELYLDPSSGCVPRGVTVWSGTYITQEYRATSVRRLANGGWIPTTVDLTAVSHDMQTRKPVKAFRWTVSTSAESLDEERIGRLERLTYPAGARIADEYTEKETVVEADPTATISAAPLTPEPAFPWYDTTAAISGPRAPRTPSPAAAASSKPISAPLASNRLARWIGALVGLAIVGASVWYLAARQRKRSAVALLGIGLISGVLGGCGHASAKLPSVPVLTELTHFSGPTFDFGPMQVRATATRMIPLYNAAPTAFVIDKIKPGCSMTVNAKYESTIEPNGHVDLPISWGINRRQDAEQPLIVVGHYLDQPDSPREIAVGMVGHPVAEIRLDPARIVMRSKPEVDEVKTLQVHYCPGTNDPPLTIASIRTTRGTVTAVWKSEESTALPNGDPLTTTTYLVQPSGERASPRTEDELILVVTSTKTEELRVPVVWD